MPSVEVFRRLTDEQRDLLDRMILNHEGMTDANIATRFREYTGVRMIPKSVRSRRRFIQVDFDDDEPEWTPAQIAAYHKRYEVEYEAKKRRGEQVADLLLNARPLGCCRVLMEV